MKKMKVPRGTARAKRRENGMLPPSADALRAVAADAAKFARRRAHKLNVSLFKKKSSARTSKLSPFA